MPEALSVVSSKKRTQGKILKGVMFCAFLPYRVSARNVALFTSPFVCSSGACHTGRVFFAGHWLAVFSQVKQPVELRLCVASSTHGSTGLIPLWLPDGTSTESGHALKKRDDVASGPDYTTTYRHGCKGGPQRDTKGCRM